MAERVERDALWEKVREQAETLLSIKERESRHMQREVDVVTDAILALPEIQAIDHCVAAWKAEEKEWARERARIAELEGMEKALRIIRRNKWVLDFSEGEPSVFSLCAQDRDTLAEISADVSVLLGAVKRAQEAQKDDD